MLEAAGSISLECGLLDVQASRFRISSSNRSPSKRGREGAVRGLAHAPGRWPEDPQPLPPFLCCYACTNRLPGSNHPAKADCAVLGFVEICDSVSYVGHFCCEQVQCQESL